MGIKSFIAKPLALFAVKQINKWKNNPLSAQQSVFSKLIMQAKDTSFGQDHLFTEINTYEDFKKNVPIADYEELRPYIDRVVNGEENVLWPGKPLYLAKTSGTTSGVKYIPISKESMPEHIKAARNALFSYIHETGKSEFVDGRLIFLQGSPVLGKNHGINTNCIEDWEDKVDAIVAETIDEDMRLISGIPPWVQMYFDRLIIQSGGKKIGDLFKNFSLFVYGGVNFEPYRARLEESIGRTVDSIETYPASEGFIAFQDSQKEKGLLLLVDAGIFYEFIPTDEYFNENPSRISLEDVELNKNYAIILNTNAGLWGYSIGDTVKFVSKTPYRIVVSGRIKHFISAFGEHVIGEEVEFAILSVASQEGVEITEFTVAPQVSTQAGELPYHEWYVEFSRPPKDMTSFSLKVDQVLQKKNVYYYDLIEGKILRPLQMHEMEKDTFINYMKSQGKLGGQNKVPRLSNDRHIANELNKWIKR